MNPIDIRKLTRLPVTRILGFEAPTWFNEEPFVWTDFQWLTLRKDGVYIRVIRDWKGAPPQAPRVVTSKDSGHYSEIVKVSDFPERVHIPFLYDCTGTEFDEELRKWDMYEHHKIPLVTDGFQRAAFNNP